MAVEKQYLDNIYEYEKFVEILGWKPKQNCHHNHTKSDLLQPKYDHLAVLASSYLQKVILMVVIEVTRQISL